MTQQPMSAPILQLSQNCTSGHNLALRGSLLKQNAQEHVEARMWSLGHAMAEMREVASRRLQEFVQLVSTVHQRMDGLARGLARIQCIRRLCGAMVARSCVHYPSLSYNGPTCILESED